MNKKYKRQTKKQAEEIVKVLIDEYSGQEVGLHFESPFQLAVALILAAQCTDERVNATTPILFKKYPTIEQKVICKECNRLIKIQEKNGTIKKIKSTIFDICDDCKNKKKEINKIKSSNRMKLNNPMFNKKTVNKVSKTLRRLYEEKCKKLNIEPKPIQYKDPNKKPKTKEEISERMKRNNPMKRPEIVEKMKKTIKERIKSGQITYKKGSESPLYKGNRPLNKYIRDHLKYWVKDQLQSANYTCQKCGKQKTTLHVHHNIPLFKIIEEFLTKYNITNKNLLSDEKLLVKFTDDIIKYHYNTKDLGIVVCKNCHDQIDKRYHKSNKNENIKNN